MVINSSDPSFHRLTNSQYSRITNTRHAHLAAESKKLRELLKTFQATLENTKFSGEDPILVFDFRTRFVKRFDSICVSEAHATLVMLRLLDCRAERHLWSIHYGARSGGITC